MAHNKDNEIPQRWIAATLATALMLVALNCHEGEKGAEATDTSMKRAIVSEDGLRILFPEGSPGMARVSTTPVAKGTALISVIAPARVVAAISGAAGNDRSIMFDSPDITSLYSSYRQARSNVDLTSKSLKRIKEMYENQGATGKDLNQAETDAANAHALIAEMEGRLRAFGFSSADLASASENTVWLISDVPENQLHEVQKGEDVDVVFTSYPEKKYNGIAESIGEVVDPVTRTVKVRVTMPNPRGRFLPGMFARVDFGDPINSVVVLPLSAIVTVDGRDYAFVQTGPYEFRRRDLTVANSTARETVVLKGIGDGERVVTSGVLLLKGLSFGY